jgi:hypothetical protein
MMNSINGLDGTQELLIKLLEQNPDDWGMRKKVVWFLYEAGYFREASKVVWNAPEIPPEDKEVVFAVRVVAKGQPTRAMRLLNAVIERNKLEPKKNLAMAKELVKGGMPLQAVRFYGAATLSDKSLIDEALEISLITTDSEEDDWSDVVQGEEFPWEGPVELTEADLATDVVVVDDEEDDPTNAEPQPVPLKGTGKSMKETMNEEEKAVDLRKPQKPLSLNPDKISTAAVSMAAYKEIENEEKEKLKKTDALQEIVKDVQDDEKDVQVEEKVSDKKVLDKSSESVSDDLVEGVQEDKVDKVDVQDEVSESIKDEVPEVVAEIKTAAVLESSRQDAPPKVEDIAEEVEDIIKEEVVEEEVVESELDDVEQPVAAKKGLFSKLTGFFRRSKKVEVESDADILAAPAPAASPLVKPKASVAKPMVSSAVPASPMMGPVKPKPVPAPAELQGGGRKYGQPEALDCRTRLVALAPQDGSAFFSELSKKYATVSGSQLPAPVKIAREAAEIDYIDLIQKACSNDKSVNLDAFSRLLGLHAAMTEADCIEWVEDMNVLRQGFGDAVLATVVSKYSVSECRDILGAVYRRVPTKAAI